MKIHVKAHKIENLDWLREWLLQSKDGIYAISPRHKARTTDQNRYYRGLLELIQKETGIDKEDVHEKMKMQFLSVPISAWQLPYCKSTKRLDTKEFWDYIENIKNFMAERIWLVLPSADERANFINKDIDG